MCATPNPRIATVDGGGSNCRACLFDFAGNVLGTALGGSANIATNFPETCQTVKATIKSAYVDAGLDPNSTKNDVAYLGLAGANIGNNARMLAQSLNFARAHVSSDREIAIQGALGDGDGTVAQVGTGSFFSQRRDGRLQHFGGWGFQLSDDCSGATLGQQLLRATIAAFDGLAPSSRLTDDILARFGTPQELVAFAQTATPRDYGTFAIDLVAAKQAGDPIATDLLATATARLVEILTIVGARQTGPICLLGGMGPTYLAMLPPEFRKKCQDPYGSPLGGAYSLARRSFLKAHQ